MKYIDLALNSNKIVINTIQCHEVLMEAKAALDHYKGSMHWGIRNNKEYLIHKISQKRLRSLGSRSSETESLHASFTHKKEELSKRVKSLKIKQSEHARMCKAVRANRVPMILAQLSRKLAEFPKIAQKTLIVGTNALYAYEAAAAVYFESDMMETEDVDVLWDTRKRVSIASSEPEGFIGILKSIDKTFSVMSGHRFRASNNKGFIVDLIQPSPKDVMLSQPVAMSDFLDDLVAVEIKGLEWLVSCPKFKSTGIDEQGFPVDLIVPDPRAFAMHKYWLSNQIDRNPQKKKRDLEQAVAVFELVNDRLPYLEFSSHALKAMPANLRRAGIFEKTEVNPNP